jgi:hypothetical protein
LKPAVINVRGDRINNGFVDILSGQRVEPRHVAVVGDEMLVKVGQHIVNGFSCDRLFGRCSVRGEGV